MQTQMRLLLSGSKLFEAFYFIFLQFYEILYSCLSDWWRNLPPPTPVNTETHEPPHKDWHGCGNQGKLKKADLREGIKSYFPDIDDEMLTGMVKAAELEMEDKEADEIEYKNLFMEVSTLPVQQP